MLAIFKTITAFAGDNLDESYEELQSQANQILHKFDSAKLSGFPIQDFRAKFTRLIADQRFINAAEKLWSHPNRKTCLYVELGFVVFMIFFKAWRSSTHKHWLGKIWVTAYCSVLFWASTLFIIPYFAYGDIYVTVLKGFWSIFA